MFFDKAIDTYFEDTPDGRVFFPLGAWTRGVIVDAKRERIVRRFTSWWVVATLMAAIPAGVAAGHYADGLIAICLALAVPVVMMLGYSLVIGHLTSGCLRYSVRLTTDEILRREGGPSRARMILSFALGTLAVATAAVLFAFSDFPLWAAIYVAGCGAALIAGGVICRRRQPRKK